MDALNDSILVAVTTYAAERPLNVAEAVKASERAGLPVSRDVVRHAVARGALTATTAGKQGADWKITPNELSRWLESRARRARA
jgi:hypothetical protein